MDDQEVTFHKRVKENMQRLTKPVAKPPTDEDIDRYFSSMSRADMRGLLINHGIQVDPDWTRRDMQLAILENNIGGPPVETTTDTDTPPQLFRLLTSILLHREASLGSELSRAAMKQRLLGELDAIHWVMQQVEDIIEANRADNEKWGAPFGAEITNEPCTTCHGQGWVVEGQSMGFPSGEQVQCPDCGGDGNDHPRQGLPHEHGLVPPQEGDVIQRDGQFYVRRGFVWELVDSPNSVMRRDSLGNYLIRSNGQWVPMRGTQDGDTKQVAGVAYIKRNGHWVEIGTETNPKGPILFPPAVARVIKQQTDAERRRHGQTDDGVIRWDIS